jgi:polyhydroxybutyrate depolymerase
MFKRIAVTIGALAAVVACLFYYYLYVPVVEPPPLDGELLFAEVTAGDLTRGFHYYDGGGVSPGAPLVFVLHGSMSNGEQARYQYGYRFDVLADQYGFIPIYPTGFDNHWNDCRSAADYQANVRDIDDIAFIQAIVDYMVENYQAGRGKVLVTGYSNGGHMAYKLALEAPGLVAAIAPISASLPMWDESDCEAKGESVAVAIMNGTQDPVNPYMGGLVSILGNDSRGTVMSSMDTAGYFAELAGHQRMTSTVQLADRNPSDSSSIELTAWQSRGLKEVLHYGVIEGGHAVPSTIVSMPRVMGPTNADIDAADEIWGFFQRVIAGLGAEPDH